MGSSVRGVEILGTCERIVFPTSSMLGLSLRGWGLTTSAEISLVSIRLEPVTPAENLNRAVPFWPKKTHCVHGHDKLGASHCMVCHRQRAAAYYRENRHARLEYARTRGNQLRRARNN